MAECNFIIPFAGFPNGVLLKAQTAIQNQGGTFNGDEAGGSFKLSIMGSTIKGSYSVRGQDLDVVIESKPFLIPCSTIESFLRNKLMG
jgi:hypothetical protein